jgi:hypothetical protein
MKAEIDADMKMEPAEEGEEKKFTFMSIGTNKIGEEAAADFQQATVLSVLRDKDVAAEMTDQIVESKIWNHAVCTKESVEETSKNLYESPELMRYIYWDGVKVSHQQSERRRMVCGGRGGSERKMYYALRLGEREPSAKTVRFNACLSFARAKREDGAVQR